VVEQYVQKALELANLAYILNHGELIYTSPASQITPDEIYQKYLGIGT
jgi:branched-chain amino acid transport system ATP-binding protein